MSEVNDVRIKRNGQRDLGQFQKQQVGEKYLEKGVTDDFVSAFDVNNDGKFDVEDLKQIDKNQDGKISNEEASLFSEKEFTLTQQKIGRSGISFDFMRYLNDLVKDGVFVEKQDKDKGGFWQTEEDQLGDMFTKIHTERGYKTEFKRMQLGEKFKYNLEEIIRLADAAGYELRDINALQEAVKKISVPEVPKMQDEQKPPEVPPTQPNTPRQKTQPSPVDDSTVTAAFVKREAVDSEGNVTVLENKNYTRVENSFTVSFDGKNYTKTFSSVEEANDFEKKLDKGMNISELVAELEPVKNTEEKQVVEEAQVETQQEIPTIPQVPDGRISEADILKALEDPELAKMTPKERSGALNEMINIYNRKIYNLSKETKMEEKETKFLGIKTGKTKMKEVKLSEEELAANKAEAEKLKQQKDYFEKIKVYVDSVQDESIHNRWQYGRQNPENGADTKDENPSYEPKKVSINGKEQWVASITEYKEGKPITKYYSLAVEKTKYPNSRQEPAYTVIADMDNEVTNQVKP